MTAATMIGASTYITISNAIIAISGLYTLMILIWAIFSWFDHSRGILRDIYAVLDKLVGPYVRIFNKILPPMGGINISPFIAFIVLQIVVQILLQLLRVIFLPI